MADFSMMGLLPIKANRGELGLGPKESTAGTGPPARPQARGDTTYYKYYTEYMLTYRNKRAISSVW